MNIDPLIYKDLLKNEYELMEIGLDPKHWKKQIICFVQGKNIYPSNSVLSFNSGVLRIYFSRGRKHF